MNDKIEKKEWWSFLSIAAYFAWALIMAVNAMNYKQADSITYVIMCAAELLAFLSSIGVDFMRYVVMEEPIGEMEPEKMEKPPLKGSESDGMLTFKVAVTVLLVWPGDHREILFV